MYELYSNCFRGALHNVLLSLMYSYPNVFLMDMLIYDKLTMVVKGIPGLLNKPKQRTTKLIRGAKLSLS